MSGEQLERSILERKERDELHAIAEAMALKPPARSKKSDIIDQILQATGIDAGAAAAANGNGTTPAETSAPSARRSNGATGRTRGAASATSTAPGADGSPLGADGSPPVLSATATGDASGTAGSGDEAAPVAPKPRRTRKASAKTTAAPALSGSTDAGPDGSASGAGDPAGTTGQAGETTPVADDVGSGPNTSAAGADAVTSSTSSLSSPGGSPNGSAPADAVAQSERSAGEQGEVQGAHAPAVIEAPAPATRNHPRQGGQGGQGGPGGPGNQAGPGNQSGQGGQGGQVSQGDAGNRRSRRRRGRDRERPGTGTGPGPGQSQELQSGGQEQAWSGELVPVKGLLDLREEGYGFLRTGGYLPSQKDVYVSVSQARRFALRRGDAIEGACRPAGPSEKYPALIRIDSVCGLTVEEARQRSRFEDLTPLFPDERLALEMPGEPSNVTARIVDLISPIGKGQRGMIVSPPKAGKTTVMKQIAHSIETNNPDVHLMVLLVDERPEEVTDMRRSVKGEVIASTFDRPAEEHTTVAELAIERAKRLVEMKRDVVIILDGITRLARAYNLGQPATGRIMSGGVDSGALYPPKKFFGAARNIEEGGSLTILATALVETGSRMDEVIFEEFKGTGNMELRLDRKLSERRIYPAIDVNASSTRHEELLFDRGQLQQVWKLRRVLNALGSEGSAAAGLELLVDKIRSTRSNDEFLAEIAKAPTPTV